MEKLKLFTVFLFILLANTIFAQNLSETKVCFETTHGKITVKLYNETPVHRDNFIKLVNQGFYDSLLFHRVIPKFMVQGGDPNSKKAAPGEQLGMGDPGYTLPAEIVPKYFHKRGALAAARTGDQMNPQRRSSGSQFYIVEGEIFPADKLTMFEKRLFTTFTPDQIQAYTTIGGTPHLDAQYTVFGEVTEGMDVISKITAEKTDTGNRPEQDVRIIKAYIVK